MGGNLEQTALLDNFSWGNPDKHDRLGGLVRSARACYDIAVAYGTPFISGKDSLYNEYRDTTTGEQLAIPPTLLISAICVMPDVSKAVSMDVKSPGNRIYVVGKTYAELGGSHYYAIHGFIGNVAPKVRAAEGKRTMEALSLAIDQGLVRSCHDCSEGGIGAAAAEMAFAGGLGMQLSLVNVPRAADVTTDDVALFSESNSRFIVEVAPEKQESFEKCMAGVYSEMVGLSPQVRQAFEKGTAGVPIGCIGTVVENAGFVVHGTDGDAIVETTIDQLKENWQGTFRW